MSEIEPYAELVKINEKSNKIYKIFIEQLDKGDFLSTIPPKVTNKPCYQVYIKSGKIAGTLKTHFYKTFFSLTAATRFAKNLKDSKLQKKYVINVDKISYPTKKEINPEPISNQSEEENFLPLFEVLPKSSYQITDKEKQRFLELLN